MKRTVSWTKYGFVHAQVSIHSRIQVCTLNNAVHIVTEFATNGDLHKLFQSSKQAGKRLEENQVWIFSCSYV